MRNATKIKVFRFSPKPRYFVAARADWGNQATTIMTPAMSRCATNFKSENPASCLMNRRIEAIAPERAISPTKNKIGLIEELLIAPMIPKFSIPA